MPQGNLTHHPNGASSFGMPLFGMGGMIPIPGNIYFGDFARGNDSNDGFSPVYPGIGGGGKSKKTLSAIQSAMTANQNDVAIITGNSSASTGAFREDADLAWTKNLTHILGNAYNRVSHRVSLRETSAGTAVVKMMDNSASGCVFANFHVFQGQSTAEDQFAWDESGERNSFFNLHIAGMGHQTPADRAGSRDMLVTGGGEHYFDSCTFGLDTIARGAANACIEFTGGVTRTKMENCLFQIFADASTPNFVLVPAVGTDRYLWLKDCIGINSGTSTIDEGLQINASGGEVICHNTFMIGVTTAENAAQSGKVWNSNVGGAATGSLGILNTG